MPQDDNVHFLRPKKRAEATAPEAAPATDGALAPRSNFDDGVISKPDNVVAIDAKRQTANAIFEARAFEGETLRMGQVLRRVREALEMNLKEISGTTRIRENFLMAIERMEINTIPKGYLNVYLRTYAQALGLAPEQVVGPYTAECGAVDELKERANVEKIGRLGPQQARWPIVAAITIALLLIGLSGLLLARYLGRDRTLTSAPNVAATANGARESLFETTETRPLPQGVTLELVARRPAWIEVRAADGTIFRSRVMAEGETYFPRVNAGWVISAEDSGAFFWRLGSFDSAPLGVDAAPLFSLSIDRELARVTEAATPPAETPPGAATPVP